MIPQLYVTDTANDEIVRWILAALEGQNKRFRRKPIYYRDIAIGRSRDLAKCSCGVVSRIGEELVEYYCPICGHLVWREAGLEQTPDSFHNFAIAKKARRWKEAKEKVDSSREERALRANA